MAYYRLYVLSSTRGQITEFHEFEATDDRSALQAAESLRRTGTLELWCRARRVAQWHAGGVNRVAWQERNGPPSQPDATFG